MRVASVNNITAQYAGQDVLKGVSFEINAGEKLGLIGANGSGKRRCVRGILGQGGPGPYATYFLGLRDEEVIKRESRSRMDINR